MPTQSYQYIPLLATLLCAQAALAQTNATGYLLRSDGVPTCPVRAPPNSAPVALVIV